MANVEPLIRSPEEMQSAGNARSHFGGIEEDGPRLLELRTDTGAIYVCPSWPQRIRLLWVFRHFHVLPPEVLSRRDRRLIEKLSRSALVTPTLPVAGSRVFGVVEKVRSKPPASIGRAINGGDGPARVRPFPAKPGVAGSGVPVLQRRTKAIPRERESWGRRGARVPWGALGVLIAVCIALMLARVYEISPFPGTAHPVPATAQASSSPTPSAPIESPNSITPLRPSSLAAGSARVSQPAAVVPGVEKSKHKAALSLLDTALAARASSQSPKELEQSTTGNAARATAAAVLEPGALTPKELPLLPASGASFSTANSSTQLTAAGENVIAGSAPAAAASTSTSERPLVAELPQGHFVYPVVSDPNLEGELHLRALIGADGSVKEVTVLSGNPKLAQAGMRAVRQWHYNPYQSLGHPVEVETQIKMNFFGQDAVSITSAAPRPTSSLK